MKLWHSLTTCLMLLLSAVHATSPSQRRTRARATVSSTRRTARATEESPLELPPVHIRLSVSSPGSSRGVNPGDSSIMSGRSTERSRSNAQGSERREETLLDVGEKYIMEESLSDEDIVDLIKVTISRLHRSSSSSTDPNARTRHRRAKKRGPGQSKRGSPGKRPRGGKGGQGCVLKQIQLNVTDLGLGYRSSEEMIFRYCSGPCRKSETNYDKILSNFAHNKRLPPKDRPAQACCRPIAFDDDLSFLDDNLIYHTVRKHSARKCACV